MITKIIGIKKFRKNITSIWKEARDKKIRYIVMHYSTPIMEVNPISKKKFGLEELANDIAEARKQVEKGEVHTQEEIMREFGLL